MLYGKTIGLGEIGNASKIVSDFWYNFTLDEAKEQARFDHGIKDEEWMEGL